MTENNFIAAFYHADSCVSEYSHIRITLTYTSGATTIVEGRLETLYYHDSMDDDGTPCYFCIRGDKSVHHITVDPGSVASIHLEPFDK